jgi:hypothetical protein
MFTKIILTKYVGIIAQCFKWQTIIFKFFENKEYLQYYPFVVIIR